MQDLCNTVVLKSCLLGLTRLCRTFPRATCYSASAGTVFTTLVGPPRFDSQHGDISGEGGIATDPHSARKEGDALTPVA
ncbi:hypothetical protein NPIL_201211 [Nephila pilipes]|uniref:Uncharacterized protein n=1 Tax=Nephila pilipes TaxID=299642 RepID=A0A8X6TG41_NEPPI|nr:hypothetical protein NPIL_201211 [Nephila pilipes]